MTGTRRSWLWLLGLVAGVVLIGVVGALVWRNDILEALLDPQLPYAVYRPPPAPDYAEPSAWALLPASAAPAGAADVFFVHPTTFDGGRDWNGPISDKGSARLLARVMLPNYAAPFLGAGPVSAPRFRQASLYTSLSLFDDALDARRFAYGDVRRAFERFRDHLPLDRPFVIVGVGQGGLLASRLLRDEIAPDPGLRNRLVAAYLIETVAPADEHGPSSPIPACTAREQTGCLLAWVSARRGDFVRTLSVLNRAVVWSAQGALVGLDGRDAVCVNPILGERSSSLAPQRLNLGAANATGLEWGVRPGFLARQVEAQCVDGILRVSTPASRSLRASGGWVQRLRSPGYNLFYADLEADSRRRVTAWWSRAQAAIRPP